MAKTEQATFYNFRTTTADGKVDTQEYRSEKQYNNAVEEAKKNGSTIEVLKAQTFEISSAESMDEILQLVPNEEVALSYFNYGLTLAQHNVKRDLMQDVDWPAQEGIYPLINDVQLPKEKRVADPLNASRKALRALWEKMNPGSAVPTDEEINAVLQGFAGAATQTTA